MLKMVERSVEREPVEILWLSFAGALIVKAVDPARKRLIGGDATEGGLPEMAVRGEKAGDDPMPARIVGLFCFQILWRIACGNGGEFAVLIDHEISSKDFFLIRRHGEQVCILNNKLGLALGVNGGCSEKRHNC